MAPEIPGYYFDEEKKKYFKVEKSQTAPSGAAWSADSVKRRKIEDERQEKAREREFLLRKHIKRCPVLSAGTVAPILLNREIAGSRTLLSPTRSIPPWPACFTWPSVPPTNAGDLGVAAWAEGLQDKDEVPFGTGPRVDPRRLRYPMTARQRRQRSRRSDNPNLSPNLACMYINGDDYKTGLGVAYTTLNEDVMVGSYIPTDEDGRIGFVLDSPPHMGLNGTFGEEMMRCPHMSCIAYHAPSHTLMLTSRMVENSCGVKLFSPRMSHTDDRERPMWLIGETHSYRQVAIRHGRHIPEHFVNRATAAPASSPDLIGMLSTNSGLVRITHGDLLRSFGPAPAVAGSNNSNGGGSRWRPREMFDMDFGADNPQVVFAGGRQPYLWSKDMREPEEEWRKWPHLSSIARVSSFGQNHVVVAGMRSSMCVYDVRFMRPVSLGSTTTTRPVLEFQNHQNEAHVHAGWDVSKDLGIVAAAQDNGTVAVFSLLSGRRLYCPAVAGIGSGASTDGTRPAVIRSLQFQTMPWERSPSLFVGEGSSVVKYSFGTKFLDDEEEG